MGLRDEIREQPDVVARLVARSAEIEAVARAVRVHHVEHVVIAARGTSDHAAIYAQYLFGIRMRLPVALAAPSIVSLYHVEPLFARSLVIGISQSGASPDVVGVVDAARRQGLPTIAITNEPGSALARAAEHLIDLGCRAGTGGRRDQDVHRRAHGHRPAGRRARRRGRAGHVRRRPGGHRGRARDRGGGARGGRGPRPLAHVHRARPRLRVRDGQGVGAQAQGAGPGRRRPVLGRGLPPRAARPGRARLPRARDRDLGSRGRRPRGPAARDPRGLRRGPGRGVGPRGRPRDRPAVHRDSVGRVRPPHADRVHRARRSCSPTTRRRPAASTPTPRGTSARSRSRPEPLRRCPGR